MDFLFWGGPGVSFLGCGSCMEPTPGPRGRGLWLKNASGSSELGRTLQKNASGSSELGRTLQKNASGSSELGRTLQKNYYYYYYYYYVGCLLIFCWIFNGILMDCLWIFDGFLILKVPGGQPWGPLEAEGRPEIFSEIFGLTTNVWAYNRPTPLF